MNERKRIIVNGDDYGMNERCTRAIAQAFRQGHITDTTMMANGAFFDGAVALAAEQGFADRIGVHLNLTEGVPLTDGIGALTDFVTNGTFNKRYLAAPRPLDPAERDAVYAELSAQVRKLLCAGIRITHADSHHYVHNIPYLAPIAAQVCKANGIGRIRLQRNFGDLTKADSKKAAACNDWLRAQGFITAAYFGKLREMRERDIPDLTELLVHPDFDRSGALIDRVGMTDGYPDGGRIPDLSAQKDVMLMCYAELILNPHAARRRQDE